MYPACKFEKRGWYPRLAYVSCVVTAKVGKASQISKPRT